MKQAKNKVLIAALIVSMMAGCAKSDQSQNKLPIETAGSNPTQFTETTDETNRPMPTEVDSSFPTEKETAPPPQQQTDNEANQQTSPPTSSEDQGKVKEDSDKGSQTQDSKPTTDTTPDETNTPTTQTAPSENPPTQPPTESATQPPAETNQPTDETTAPTEAKKTIDTGALCQYGITYAVDTYGYEYWPGMRDGWYPPCTAYIPDMETGYEAIRGCVDSHTRTLEARGEPIVEIVDGVAYGMPIDIVITPDPDGFEDSYLIYIYY